MRRRFLQTGCILAWGLAALLGGAGLVFAAGWAGGGSRAAGFFTMMLLPLFLLALWGAVWGTVWYEKRGGRTPGEKR